MIKYSPIFLSKSAKLTIEELKKTEYDKIKIDQLMPSFMNIQTQSDRKVALEYIT